ncbi:hypothetical protein H4R33_006119 [Dimargaris cristalligena]|uniref:DnaJ domain-containing protein n=1 Tax=Dimargaris cristalligena TaxID=215637 RepID=A0A4P9ZPG8_9FUNG|nr:hypothetical protein H4R33_006119 [Dimargaris cristalligena]RKP35336.1 DnaJ domain-containing protein [Dimargaris cristalligena]|eukprot:RKP35336.1 DnaJ domain-containing protein [Dimargaris cristalligena]
MLRQHPAAPGTIRPTLHLASHGRPLFPRTTPYSAFKLGHGQRTSAQLHQRTSPRSPYEVFDLPLTATPAEIKERYRELCLQWHPDRVAARPPQKLGTTASPTPSPATQSSARSSDTVLAQERFVEINDAYQTLCNPALRLKYQRVSQHRKSAASFYRGDDFIYNDPRWQHMYATTGPAAAGGKPGEAEEGPTSAQRALNAVIAMCCLFGIGHFLHVMSISTNVSEQFHHDAWLSYRDAKANAQTAGSHEKSIESFLARKAAADEQRELLAKRGY